MSLVLVVILRIEEEAMSVLVFYYCIGYKLFPVTVTLSTHCCVACCHVNCLVSLFQGHVACWNFILAGPQ